MIIGDIDDSKAPLLDLALLRGLPGYVEGLTIGTLYFTGFTGLVLVISVYLQEGLAYTPLHAGLLLMPFAAGAAVAAPLAGRIVSDVGRRLTVIALVVMAVEMVMGFAVATAIYRARQVDMVDMATDLKG